jgi:hypothetical protein
MKNLQNQNDILGSTDEGVQEASADCLQNIRKLALACEKLVNGHNRHGHNRHGLNRQKKSANGLNRQ